MITDFNTIEHSALELDEKHRAELAKLLLLSLEDQIDEEIEQAWIKEVKRRKKEVESGEVSTIPADEAFAKARNILK